MSKRTRVIALAVMVLLTVGVYGVLLMLILEDRPAEPVAVPTPLAQLSGTALEEVPRAEEMARAWQGDAQLVGVSGAWREPTEIQLLDGRTAWVFQFFSPSAKQMYRATVAEAEVEGAPDRTLDGSPPSIDRAEWQVDSSEALLLFLSHGGREFLADHHVTSVRLRLSAALSPGRVVWLVAALSSTERTGLGVLVDALSGKVEEAQPLPVE